MLSNWIFLGLIIVLTLILITFICCNISGDEGFNHSGNRYNRYAHYPNGTFSTRFIPVGYPKNNNLVEGIIFDSVYESPTYKKLRN